MRKEVNAMSKLYPDISHHHPVKNWDKVAQNVGFLISKATEGTSFVDSTLDTFIKECEKRKIPYWLYVFLRRGNELEQTKFMVKTCKKKVGKYFRGYVLDVESGNGAGNVGLALEWLQKQTAKTMIYTGWADYSKYKAVIEARGKNCAWWEARYGLNNGKYVKLFTCHKGVDLHQFTSNGTCPGIPDKIDMNRLTGTLPEEWFTGAAAADPEPEAPKPAKYTGDLPKLPARGYYQLGDGMTALTKRRADIRLVQEVTNWITGGTLVIDGCYGELTKAAVMRLQNMLGVKADGLFGEKTLAAVKIRLK